MEAFLGDWVGRSVFVTLKPGGMAGPATVEGTSVRVGEAGLMLEMAKGRTFVPVASVLHVGLLHGN